MKTLIIISTIALLYACSSNEEIKLPEPPKEIIVNCDATIEGLEQDTEVTDQKCTLKISTNSDGFMVNYKVQTKINMQVYEGVEFSSNKFESAYFELHFLNKSDREVCSFIMVRATDLKNLAEVKPYGSGDVALSFEGKMPIILDHNEMAEKEATDFVNELKSISKVKLKFVESKKSSGGDTCDEFVEYKEAVEEYIDILQEIKDDPTNVTNASKVSKIAQKVSEKAQGLINCANYGDLQGEIAELQEKINSLR